MIRERKKLYYKRLNITEDDVESETDMETLKSYKRELEIDISSIKYQISMLSQSSQKIDKELVLKLRRLLSYYKNFLTGVKDRISFLCKIERQSFTERFYNAAYELLDKNLFDTIKNKANEYMV